MPACCSPFSVSWAIAATWRSKAPAKAWLDLACSYTTNEIAINWNAPLVYVSAALQALGPR